MLRSVSPDDAEAIAGIYNYYVEHTVITFEEDTLSAAEMKNRILEITENYPWFVWEDSGGVIGFAYAHKWRERASYRFSAEDSIYVKRGCEGKGIGGALLQQLIEQLAASGVHALVAGITLPNERSVTLHEKFSFKKTAEFPEIGFKNNRWLAVGYWELIL